MQELLSLWSWGVFTNLEALQTPMVMVFLVAMLRGHD